MGLRGCCDYCISCIRRKSTSAPGLDAAAQKREEFFDMERFAKNRFGFQAVLLGETDADVVVGFGKVVHDTIDIGFDIFRAMDVKMLFGDNVHRIGDTKVIPQELVKRGMLVDPQDLLDRHDGIAGAKS